MIWDDLVEVMLKGVADELGWEFSKRTFGKLTSGYLLSKGKKMIGFSYFVNTQRYVNDDRMGKLKIIMSPRLDISYSKKLIDLGDYT